MLCLPSKSISLHFGEEFYHLSRNVIYLAHSWGPWKQVLKRSLWYRGVWAQKAKLWLTVETLRSSLQVCSLLILSLKCFVNWLRCSQKNWQMQQKTRCKALWRKFISGYITLNFCRSSQSEAQYPLCARHWASPCGDWDDKVTTAGLNSHVDK